MQCKWGKLTSALLLSLLLLLFHIVDCNVSFSEFSQILFSFQFSLISRCPMCKAIFHRECAEELKAKVLVVTLLCAFFCRRLVSVILSLSLAPVRSFLIWLFFVIFQIREELVRNVNESIAFVETVSTPRLATSSLSHSHRQRPPACLSNYYVFFSLFYCLLYNKPKINKTKLCQKWKESKGSFWISPFKFVWELCSSQQQWQQQQQ